MLVSHSLKTSVITIGLRLFIVFYISTKQPLSFFSFCLKVLNSCFIIIQKLFCILSTLLIYLSKKILDQLAIANVCIYKTFYELFSAQDSNSFSTYQKCILDVTLQDVTLQLTDPSSKPWPLAVLLPLIIETESLTKKQDKVLQAWLCRSWQANKVVENGVT